MSGFDGVQFGDVKDKSPRKVLSMGALDENPKKVSKDSLPPPLVADPKAFLAGIQAFEQVAQGQQRENQSSLDLAQGVAKIQETRADTARKNAKAELDLVAATMKMEKDAVELQKTKAENTAVTGFVDDTDLDASVAAVAPNFAPGTTLDFGPGSSGDPAPKLGEVDPRSARHNLFPSLQGLDNAQQTEQLMAIRGQLLTDLEQGLKESKERDLFNSSNGLAGIVPGLLLDLASLPVTAFTGGQGLGTTFFGGTSTRKLDNALRTLDELNPLLNSQISLARTNIDAQQAIDINLARKLSSRGRGPDLEEAERNFEFKKTLHRTYVQDLSNLSQALGGNDAVLWTGNAVDASGRRVEAGAGLNLFRKFNQIAAEEDSTAKAQLLKEFDSIMQGFYDSTSIPLSFDVFDNSISTLAPALRDRHLDGLKPPTSKPGRDLFTLQKGTVLDFTELLDTDFREFARQRFNQVKTRLKKQRKDTRQRGEPSRGAIDEIIRQGVESGARDQGFFRSGDLRDLFKRNN